MNICKLKLQYATISVTAESHTHCNSSYQNLRWDWKIIPSLSLIETQTTPARIASSTIPVVLEVIWARESDLCYGCLGLGWLWAVSYSI